MADGKSETTPDILDFADPQAEYERLRTALAALLKRYTGLANSGDCGFWNPETEPEVIAAREALK